MRRSEQSFASTAGLWGLFLALFCGAMAVTAPPAVGQSYRVLDVSPGESGSVPFSLAKQGERLFFTAHSLGPVRGLWTSDGTAAGTYLVKQTCTEDCFNAYPRRIVATGDLVFFSAGENGDDHRGLWRSDGTAAGTFQVGFCQDPEGLTAVGNSLFFTCFTPGAGRELWTSDGSVAGTFQVEDLRPGPDDSFPFYYDCDFSDCLVDVGGTLFFTPNDGVHGRELWTSDGSRGGTVMVADLNPGGDGTSLGWLTTFDGELFFNRDSTCDAGELWKSDGTEAGTEWVASPPATVTNARFCPTSWGPDYLTPVGDSLFYVSGNLQDDETLWKTDGTSVGTASVDEGFDYIEVLGATGVRILFWQVNYPMQLWASDGTPHGTQMIREFGDEYPGGGAALLGNTLFFRGWDPPTGVELWSSDGTVAGTAIVQDAEPGPGNFSPELLTGGDGPLFFRAFDPELGHELFVLDSWHTPFDVDVAVTGGGSGSVASKPGGIRCGSACEESFLYGTRVSLEARPDYGSQFEGWGGHADCADGGLTVFDDRSCVAAFGPCTVQGLLELAGVTIDDWRELIACNEVRVGAGVELTETAEVEVRAGNQVVFEGPFALAPGGDLKVEIGPPN